MELDSLEEDIKLDLDNSLADKKESQKKDFSKMSKTNLAKQDKDSLISYARDKNLLKDMTERSIIRLNRKELADIIKPSKTTVKKDTSDDRVNDFKQLEKAVSKALGGEYDLLDSMAKNTIKSDLINLISNEGEDLDEKTIKKIKIGKFLGSAMYLVFRLTGGFRAWKQRAISLIEKIKNRKKKIKKT